MSIIVWLCLGLVAGFIGCKLRSGTGPKVLPDVAFGLLSAAVGGSFLFGILQSAPVIGFDAHSLVLAAIGASIVLWIGQAIGRRRTP